MQFYRPKRREFITLIGGTAAAWPLAARSEQGERMRRIGVLVGVADDPQGQARLAAFRTGMQALGWADGRNIRFEVRFTGGAADRSRGYAAELVSLSPDLITARTPSARSNTRQRPFRSCSPRWSIR